MRILVDMAIPDAVPALAPLGDVRTFDGRDPAVEDLQWAEALVIRSVTRVDALRLDGTPVRFVGSVTSGMDHIEVDGLRRRGIAVASAAGFNARPVAEYVVAALLEMAGRLDWDLNGKTAAVIGAGRIGSLVGQWCGLLGMRVLWCDPPLEATGRTGSERPWVMLHEALRNADLATLHVPLIEDGPDRTRGMIDVERLSWMKPEGVLVNTSRGEVVDESSLLRALQSRRLAGVVLDVWRNEPRIDAELVRHAAIATPHIAGYSREAPSRGIQMICRSLKSFMSGASRAAEIGEAVPGGEFRPVKAVSPAGRAGMRGMQAELRGATVSACGLLEMDRRLRESAGRGKLENEFDRLREAARERHEFGHCSPPEAVRNVDVRKVLRELGFPILNE